jgi:anti-sigma regulatory factor (Ser/Thr protein kinase)
VSSEESITLQPDLHAPARARTWLAERVAALAPLVADDALLVASELVTNAVRHGRPEIALSVRRLPDGVRIAVRDEGEHVPVPAMDTPTVDRPTGRGLLIVAATARHWGVTPHPDRPGKTVWAEL